MTTTFKTHCSGHCICATATPAATRIFNASLEYEAGGEKHVEDLVLVVPSDAHIGQIKQAMACAVRERITPKGSSNGFLKFRLDGRSGELSFLQWVQDIWFRFTWRGKPFTGSHFVPIWPTAPAVPAH
jgi:hypothetical protein